MTNRVILAKLVIISHVITFFVVPVVIYITKFNAFESSANLIKIIYVRYLSNHHHFDHAILTRHLKQLLSV